MEHLETTVDHHQHEGVVHLDHGLLQLFQRRDGDLARAVEDEVVDLKDLVDGLHLGVAEAVEQKTLHLLVQSRFEDVKR